MADAPCPRCDTLRAELREAREQRDAALLAVAVERERADALFIAQVESQPKPPPEKPLRYWAVDVINSGLKKGLPWPHNAARLATSFLRRFRGRGP